MCGDALSHVIVTETRVVQGTYLPQTTAVINIGSHQRALPVVQQYVASVSAIYFWANGCIQLKTKGKGPVALPSSGAFRLIVLALYLPQPNNHYTQGLPSVGVGWNEGGPVGFARQDLPSDDARLPRASDQPTSGRFERSYRRWRQREARIKVRF